MLKDKTQPHITLEGTIMNEHVSLQLAKRILTLLLESGTSQFEQFAALNMARTLVPLYGSPLNSPQSAEVGVNA